jgi:hypothetical protein
MIMNAIFNAPVDETGNRRYIHKPRTADVVLDPDERATLRWAVGERFILLSIKDPFGSISAKEILAHTTGPAAEPELGSHQLGAGIGLHIMSRAAHHLIFVLHPGRQNEIVALVERNPASSAPKGSSLSILHGVEHEPEQLGNYLWYTAVRSQDVVRLRLVGEIDESCDLRPIFNLPGFVWLDLGGVKGINSVGIRAWLEAFRGVEEPPHVFFERCSPAVVSQINMIPAFAATGRLLSLYVPYYCPSCGEEFSELLSVEQVKCGTPPDRFCGGCGGGLEFDGLPAQYFAFTGR